MSFTKQVTIWCDSCGEWEQESPIQSNTVAALRKKLKINGWTSVKHIGDGFGWSRIKDYCPRCSERYREEVKKVGCGPTNDQR